MAHEHLAADQKMYPYIDTEFQPPQPGTPPPSPANFGGTNDGDRTGKIIPSIPHTCSPLIYLSSARAFRLSRFVSLTGGSQYTTCYVLSFA